MGDSGPVRNGRRWGETQIDLARVNPSAHGLVRTPPAIGVYQLPPWGGGHDVCILLYGRRSPGPDYLGRRMIGDES